MPGEFFLGTWERREREPRLPAVQKGHCDELLVRLAVTGRRDELVGEGV